MCKQPYHSTVHLFRRCIWPTPKELLDELLKDVKFSEDLLGKDGLLKQLTKDLVERVLEAELTNHLSYEKHAVEF